jgi:hypothetical protein
MGHSRVSLSHQANTLELTYEEKQEMTRKDYVLIAQAIADVYCDSEAQLLIADSISQALQADNARFDRARFLTACGVK